MLTLGIDTTADFCAVGLWDGEREHGRVRASRRLAMARGHAETLFPMLDDLLGEAGVVRGDLGRVAVVRGPGTFTGTRIGLAAARGLALALAIPAVGLTTFELLAVADSAHTDDVAARAIVLDARRGEVYLQVIAADLSPLTSPVAVTPKGAVGLLPAGPLVALGSGAGLLAEAASVAGRALTCRAETERDGALVAQLGASLDPTDHPPLPLYLRPPDATPPAPTLLRTMGVGDQT